MSMKRPAQSTARLKEFIDHEATGGLLLALAAFVAFLLVNAGFATQYNALLDERVRIGVGALTLDKSLHHFINDGLMAIFFFLVGMEIKREALEGTLVRFSDVLLPAAAALGGIAAPSAIFVWFNWDNAATIGGWAIPAATDIAFALGALALLGVRAPLSLKIFLLTLATFDDLAAIVIIALFYTAQLSVLALGGALVCLAGLFVYNCLGGERRSLYVLVGLLMWVFVLKSGVHATLAGVALGLLIPLRRADGSSLLHDLEAGLHNYVKFAVLPLFAFANAGLPAESLSLAVLAQPLPLGVAAGLFVGKPVGVLLAVGALMAMGVAKLPPQVSWRYMIGVSFLAGIGFTMSLFIGSLAFSDAALQDQVRAGVVAGSLLSMLVGMAIMWPGKVERPN
jgi:Na+:H+ antiporter, NhaA family